MFFLRRAFLEAESKADAAYLLFPSSGASPDSVVLAVEHVVEVVECWVCAVSGISPDSSADDSV